MSEQDQQEYVADEDLKRERRKHWRDRRKLPDRRNPERLMHTEFDCRSDTPRRKSDLGGYLADGEVWWRHEEETD